MFEPATAEVTPVFVIVKRLGVPEATDVLIPVPPVKSTLSPSEMSCAVPESASKLHEVYAPAGVAQTLSPLRNVVAPGVPVADKSIVPIVTAPVALELAVEAETKVPFVLVKDVTPNVAVPLEAAVTIPCALTVTVACVYVFAVTPELGILTDIVPLLVIGELPIVK
jgi:hypothetical protein